MMAHRWGGRRSHRSIVGLMTALALAVGACSSDDNDAANRHDHRDHRHRDHDHRTPRPRTTATDTTDTTAESSDPPTSLANATGEVTPVVICVDENRGVAYFGYTNSGSSPVEIAVGDANRVTLPDGTALTDQQPDVFATGEQGVVFWTEFLDPAFPPTWALTGADGTERTASADASAPTCPDRQPPLDPPDDRAASVVGTVDSDGDSARITITVEELPDESRCPSGSAGWTPDPADVFVEAAGANVTTQHGDDPSTAQLTVDDLTLAPSAGFDVTGFASIFVWVDVDDRCTNEAGVTSRAWGASESLRDLSQIGARICFGAIDDGYREVDCDEGPTLAPTGGIRSR